MSLTSGLTTAKVKGSLALDEYIDGFLSVLDRVADLVDVTQEADVVGEKGELGGRAGLLALVYDLVCCRLGATDDVNASLLTVFGELPQGVFSESIGSADEDCHHARR